MVPKKEYSQTPKAIRRRAYRAKNLEKVRAQANAWYAKNPEKGYPGGWSQVLFYTARSNSRKYGRPITIDPQYLRDLWARQNGRCHWSGVPLEEKRKSPWIVSIDRIDNTRGYEPGNVVLSSWVMNRARGALPAECFREVLNVLSLALSAWAAPELETGK